MPPTYFLAEELTLSDWMLRRNILAPLIILHFVVIATSASNERVLQTRTQTVTCNVCSIPYSLEDFRNRVTIDFRWAGSVFGHFNVHVRYSLPVKGNLIQICRLDGSVCTQRLTDFDAQEAEEDQNDECDDVVNDPNFSKVIPHISQF